LKFGLYTAIARSTCGGKAASCGFEKIDADQYAAWQVDYVKEDGCGSCTTALQDIATMQAALTATGDARRVFAIRPIAAS
jgi:alpha-galactosidase